mmetsp:Transcript_5223/g.18309  ORF Transcript_5223/g.18309 Transcript_5223/m.18309 type:complete len:360 (-) Transcript_5223:1176-2255(-)
MNFARTKSNTMPACSIRHLSLSPQRSSPGPEPLSRTSRTSRQPSAITRAALMLAREASPPAMDPSLPARLCPNCTRRAPRIGAPEIFSSSSTTEKSPRKNSSSCKSRCTLPAEPSLTLSWKIGRWKFRARSQNKPLALVRSSSCTASPKAGRTARRCSVSLRLYSKRQDRIKGTHSGDLASARKADINRTRRIVLYTDSWLTLPACSPNALCWDSRRAMGSRSFTTAQMARTTIASEVPDSSKCRTSPKTMARQTWGFDPKYCVLDSHRFLLWFGCHARDATLLRPSKLFSPRAPDSKPSASFAGSPLRFRYQRDRCRSRRATTLSSTLSVLASFSLGSAAAGTGQAASALPAKLRDAA